MWTVLDHPKQLEVKEHFVKTVLLSKSLFPADMLCWEDSSDLLLFSLLDWDWEATEATPELSKSFPHELEGIWGRLNAWWVPHHNIPTQNSVFPWRIF